MPRSFCTAGPVQPERQYCLPPTMRVGFESVGQRIAERKYFVLHAPRQTGKTTALHTLVTELQADGLRAVYANSEPAQTVRNDVAEGVRTILGCLARDAAFFGGICPGPFRRRRKGPGQIPSDEPLPAVPSHHRASPPAVEASFE